MVKPGTSEQMSPGSRHASDIKYKGVRKRKWGKWVSEIRLPNSRDRIWLGSYDSPEKAARAFDAAQFCLRGTSAKFNFPDDPPNIPGGTSLPPSEIQAAAARFANSATSPPPPPPPHHSQDHNSSSSGLLSDSPSSPSVSYLDHFPTVNLDDSNMSVPDFGIFPGFDDYFMRPPPALNSPRHDYGEETSDGIFSQDPSFLWNF